MARSTNRQGREARDRLRVYEARQTVHREGRSRRIRDNVVAVVGIVAVGALATVTQVFYFTAGPGAPTPSPSASAAASTVPPADLSEFRTWTGSLTIGDVAVGIELDGELAPQATAGWVQDAATGYYLDTTCHRIAADFSFLQCGSIDGLGSPDPTFQYGPIENAPADDIYPTGTIAMARRPGRLHRRRPRDRRVGGAGRPGRRHRNRPDPGEPGRQRAARLPPGHHGSHPAVTRLDRRPRIARLDRPDRGARRDSETTRGW